VTPRRLILSYVLDVLGPLLAYLLAQALGARAGWALMAGGAVAGAVTLLNTVRRKGLDALGALVLVEMAAAAAVLLLVRDQRLLLLRPALYTAIAGIYLAGTVLVGRPASVAGARVMAAQGGAARAAAYDRAWERSLPFRRTHQLVTLGFGVALLVDAAQRTAIVLGSPLSRALWLSKVPHAATMGLVLLVSALAGRRFKRLVEEQMRAAP
jgi:hypothetical protein